MEDRKLIAEGYCSYLYGEEECTIVFKIIGEDEEYYAELPPEKIPKDIRLGSMVRAYEDSTQFELFEPVWTAEDIERIRIQTEELEEILKGI